MIKISAKSSSTYIRKFIHFFVGVLCSLSPFYFQKPFLPLIISFLFVLINIFAHFNKKIYQKIDLSQRLSYGIIFFPIAYMINVICFWDFKFYFCLSFLILAICDPIAAIIGEKKGTKNYFIIWKDRKSLSGTLAFFVCSFTLSVIYGNIFLEMSSNKLFLFSLFVSFGSTLAEILSNKGSDNISIPFFSILFMFSFENFDKVIFNISNIIIFNHIKLFIIVSILFTLAFYYRLLSQSGYFSGLLMASIITFLGGLKFLIPLAFFFILSSLLSILPDKDKLRRDLKPKRDILQVYANGGFGLLICCYDHFNPSNLNYFLFLSSISAAISDTWATEIGRFSKNEPISIINFNKIEKGLSGGITFLGLFGSILGPTLLTFFSYLYFSFSFNIFFLIIFTGFLGSILDSILGASVQAKYRNQNGILEETNSENNKIVSGYSLIDNNFVNFINTSFSPILFYIMFRLMGFNT